MSHEEDIGGGRKNGHVKGFIRTRISSSAKHLTENNNNKDLKKGHGREQQEQRGVRRIPDKVFMERDSLLTQMFQVPEFRGLYNIFLVIFLNVLVYAVLSDYARFGELSLGWANLVTCFGKPWLTLGVVGGLHLGAILSHAPFSLWSLYRRKVGGTVDGIYAIYMSTFIALHIYLPILIHSHVQFPLASAAIVVTEQVRLLMKLYAFYRVNISRTLKGEVGGDFSKHLYFLYAPTLIYQDSYPRTKEIRWGFVIQNLVELLGCICFYNVIHYLCGWVLLERFGLEPITLPNLVDAIFFQMIPGGVGFLLGFFILLHTSQNLFAELLKFGDREFYKDWWNSETFSDFYRNWNLPVHGFLYTYIYKEAVEFGFRSKFVPAICVFFVSSIVHEYILAFALGFFFPVLLLFFGGFGVALSFCNRPRVGGNPFIWWSLITGKGLILFFYSLEHFARVNNCPPAQTVLCGGFSEVDVRRGSWVTSVKCLSVIAMVMSLVLDYWETRSLSAGCNLFAPRFHFCVSNVQRAHVPSINTSVAQMRFSEREKTLVPLDTILATTLPKLLLSLTILCLNALLLFLRRDTQQLPLTTRTLLRSLLVTYAVIAGLTIYAEVSVTLFLFWGVRIVDEQWKECLIVNSLLIGLFVGVSLHALSLALDWSLLPLPQYKHLARGTLPLWLLALWTQVIIMAALPIGGWRTDSSFCVFLLQFERTFLKFVGGIHLTAFVLSIFLPLFLRVILRPSRNAFVHNRWKRKLQKQQRLTIFLVVSFHALCSTPFNAFLFFLPLEMPNPLTLNFLFIPTLIPPLIVPLLLAVRATPPLPTNQIPQNKNPLSGPLFFLDSSRIQQHPRKPPGQPHFFSTHYLPKGNGVRGVENRTPSVHSYQTTSSDSNYGFPIQETISSRSKGKSRR